MSCAACQALSSRITELERFRAELEERLKRAPKTSGCGVWPKGWPAPGADETTESRRGAFRAGGRARHGGQLVSACPYGIQSRGHDNSWRRGWRAMDRMLASEGAAAGK